jgi:predicted negative regulator of RcsB-dependent stress response
VAQHISRKELKTDDVRAGFVHGAEAVASHWKLVGWIATVALIVVGAIFGWRIYAESQSNKASAELADAMKIFDARIRGVGEPALSPGDISYVDEQNKYSDASKKLAAVADKYGRTRPGQQARYYEALCYERLGNLDKASTELTALANGSNADLEPLASFQLALVDLKMGKDNLAIQLYQQLMAKPTVLVPKPTVMLALADYYSKKNPPEAIKLLNQIKQEFPDSPSADEATKRLEATAGQS